MADDARSAIRPGGAPLLDLAGPPITVHVIGAGGAGMNAIASVLLAMGHSVTGTDLKESNGLTRLRAQGGVVHVGHDAAHLGAPDVVAVSTAVPEDNPEVRAARERGIPVLRRAEILAAIAATRRTVAVSGTHGKTTTSSMLALALVGSALAPSFIIGGDLNEIGSGAVWTDGELFVVEADESDGTFLELPADSVVVTNVEADHLDHYGDLAHVKKAFEQFVRQAPGVQVVGIDEPNGAELARVTGAITYGTAAGADYWIAEPTIRQVGATGTIVRRGEVLGRLTLPVPGLHNLRNATAALAMAMELGADFDRVARALGRFGGVARRFQFRGEVGGVTFVDDYAHNPGKVRAVMEAVEGTGWTRVVAVFQPHRYSRTQDLWREFGDAFPGADLVVVTDVYGAGETPRPGVSGHLVVEAILAARPGQTVVYLPQRRDVVDYLAGHLRTGDLCLTLGAGDVTTYPSEIMTRLRERAEE
ncbi:MAG TPA: UDP-N-acetylmuramate--L-alanine ligase [Acidimicrobiales bacterium]|jgi:UDP-N-acetylmuramate--alanine ligase|nr:UDP-N-acetylmuramate--L-alanine ligase [Acidimicrobiales bacterium]